MFGGRSSLGNHKRRNVLCVGSHSMTLYSLHYPGIALNELLSFDLETLIWSELNASLVKGEPPFQRYFPGFASMDNKLFIFGGRTSSSLAGHCGFKLNGPGL